MLYNKVSTKKISECYVHMKRERGNGTKSWFTIVAKPIPLISYVYCIDFCNF